MRFYHDHSEIRHGADPADVDIGFQDKIICGKFVDEERPTFTELMNEHYTKTLGDKYVPMSPEGGLLREPAHSPEPEEAVVAGRDDS